MAGCCYGVVACCEGIRGLPSAILCVSVFLLQAACMDYYLVEYLGDSHFIWIAADAVNLTLLVICIYIAHNDISAGRTTSTVYNIASASWLLMSISLAVKMIIVIIKVADKLDEDDPGFMGPNTFKTGIGLSGVVFLCLLMTQHDAPVGSERRQYIEELTGTVVFDLLDTVDTLEVLFDVDKRATLWNGLEEFILCVATMNLLIPAVPLFTLSRTNYGHEMISSRLVYAHRLALVLIVNIPNLLVRMILWHGLSVGISPFCLKNLILICMTVYVFYEHFKEHYEKKKEEEDLQMDIVSTKKRYSLRGPEDSDPNSHKPPPLYIDDSDSDIMYRRHSRHQSTNSERNSRYSHYNDFEIENRMVTSI